MSDPYESDWQAMCIDYGPGKNAFQAAQERPLPPVLTKEEAKAEAHRKAVLRSYHKTQAIKKATRVNQPNFHIQTVAESLAMQDKARKLMGKSAGGAR